MKPYVLGGILRTCISITPAYRIWTLKWADNRPVNNPILGYEVWQRRWQKAVDLGTHCIPDAEARPGASAFGKVAWAHSSLAGVLARATRVKRHASMEGHE